MHIVKNINKLRQLIRENKNKGKTIGLVPTMGALHNGHISLIKKSKKETNITVVSIFVNPTQFGPNEDYSKYPRILNEDIKLLKQNKCDILFIPNEKIMYNNSKIKIVVEDISDILCGKYRKGHFDGVCTIVGKLFNIILPDKAFFGEKDFQQLFIIKKMVKDLNFPVIVRGCPIIRGKDGLAMSSRNIYLSKMERESASQINKILKYGKILLKNNEKISCVKRILKNKLNKLKFSKLQYLEILDEETLGTITDNTKKIRIFVAVYIGKTRLIDNIGVKKQ